MRKDSNRVECEIEETELYSDQQRRMVRGVCVRCGKCDQEATAFGTGEASVKRALVTLREECQNEENNFYVGKNED